MADMIQSDVLVVGGGGAAARTAITAHQAGAKVVLVVKGRFGAFGTRGGGATACGVSNHYGFFDSRGVPGKPAEEEELIVRDVIQAGLGMAEPYLAKALARDRFEARHDLEKWGLLLTKSDPNSDTRRRVLVMPGLAYVVKGAGITVQERTMITDLLVQDGRCVGAVGVDEDGKTYIIKAGATILSTGGNAHLFLLNCHPTCVTGDGYAMGYEAGAELMNMEFMQIFIDAVYPSVIMVGRISWWQHPKLYNAQGREFLPDHMPQGASPIEVMDQAANHSPYSTRDSLSRYLNIALTKETIAGRANEHNALYLQLPHPELVEAEMRDWYKYRSIDLSQPIEINTVHQCSNGGLRMDENGQTTLPGLYAVGEVATGCHGADRLGGHMMACSQVFGRRAGLHATAAVRERGSPTMKDQVAKAALSRIEALRKAKGNKKPAEILKGLQQRTWEDMLAVRSQDSINRVLNEIQRIRAEDMPRLKVENSTDLTQALELQSILMNGEMVGQAALIRTESRGGHYREDFPNRDDRNWLKTIVIKKWDGKMQLSPLSVDPGWKDLPGDLGDRIWG